MNKNTPKKKQVTLEMIEKHLEKQDIESMKTVWLVPVSFAAAIILSGASLWITTRDPGILIVGFVYLGLVYWTYRKFFKRLPL